MDKQERADLCAAAVRDLSQTPAHRNIAWIWAGVAAAAGLLGSLLSFFLDSRIAQTGSLDGIGLRSFLSTVQMAVSLFTMIALPFWNIGHTAAALEISRSRQAKSDLLLEGFRRFGPVLRYHLLQALLVIVLAIVSMNVGNVLFSLTPLALPLTAQMMEIMETMYASPDYVPDPAAMEEILKGTIPLLIGCAVLFLVLYILVAYRLRLVPWLLMDEPRCGALAAMAASVRQMRGCCLSLFLLDLRFWWFYLAEMLIAALCYGDVLLPLLGVNLPVSRDAAYFLFYAAAMVAQVGLYGYAKNRLAVTYAKFYDAALPYRAGTQPMPPENM